MILLNPNLHAFIAVCEFSTISAAAENIGLTQTGATQRIKSLERDLGVALFTRSRKGMKPTPEGEALLRHCLEAKDIEGRMMLSLKKRGEEQDVDLTLAGPASLIAGRFAIQCQPIFKNFQRLNLRFIVDVNANRLNHLKRGTADLAVVLPHEMTNELDSKQLKPVEYVLLASPKWKGRHLKDILENERLYAYHPGDETSMNYLKEFNLFHHVQRPRLYVNENQALENLISLGIGYGVLPKETVKTSLDAKKLIMLNQERTMKVPMTLVWYPRNEMPKYLSDLIQVLK